MYQETGETRDAMIEDDNRQIEAVLAANKHRTNPYWIVVFAKPSKVVVEGRPTLMKHIKPYGTKPPSQVGQIIGKVDNSTGKVDWEVNMPQVPFNFDVLQTIGGKPCNEAVIETTTIPGAYITK